MIILWNNNSNENLEQISVVVNFQNFGQVSPMEILFTIKIIPSSSYLYESIAL